MTRPAAPGAWLMAVGAGVAAALLAPPLAAQTGRRLQPEARVDVIAGRSTALHAGVGLSRPLGTYVRVGAVAAGGVVTGGSGSVSGGELRASARGDLLARFLLDPFLQSRWAPYAGGGASARYDEDGRARGYMVAFVGVEGPPMGGLLPALEVGLGGGTRMGVTLRRALEARR